MADSTSDEGLHKLCMSIKNNEIEAVQDWLDTKPDVNKVWEKEQITPLSLASSLGYVEFVHLLVCAGADVNLTGPDGKTALHHTCSVEERKPELFDILEVLLQSAQNINIDKKDNMECTSLFYACQSDDVKIVQRLIGEGCDVNVSTMEGDTPLKVSCRNAEFRFFWKGRCELGGKEDFKPNSFPSVEITKLLLQAGANPCEATFLPTAVQFSAVDLVIELLDLGMDVNMQDDNQRSPLGCACSSSNVDPKVVRLLLDRGADVNKGGGWKKQKPLIFAYVHNSVEKIRLLLSYGAKVTDEEMTELVSMTLSKSFLENPDIVGPKSKELVAWRLLFAAGFRPQVDALQVKRHNLRVMSSYDSISEWIDDCFFYPVRSLKECCRVSIRQNVHPIIDEKIELLPLPPQLKLFLQFSEFNT